MAQIYYMGVPYGGRTTGGGSGDAYWGNIGGVLANQTDLKTALDGKSAVTANPTLVGTESNLTSVEIDGTKYGISGGGGSSVEWEQIVESGTKIATISIDGDSTDVYAPNGGGDATWGSITGTLSNQTDLVSALNSVKADVINYVNTNILGGTA